MNSLLLDRRLWLGTAGRVLILVILLNIGIAWNAKALVRKEKENLLATSKTNSAIMAKGPPRWDVSIGDSLARFLNYVPDATANRLIYLVGMSQMYRINDEKPGDETISEHVDDMVRPHARVFGLAAPNLDNEEALFLLLTVLQDPKTTPATFIYALCFDKMRFLDVRPHYLEYLRAHPVLEREMTDAAKKYAATYPLAADKIRSTLSNLRTQAAEQDNSFEHRLREKTARVVPLVESRKQLNTFLTFGLLYGARNKLLGIKTTTKRPVIGGRYEMNQQFLLMMADIAKARGITFIYYINPLNPQAENPYVTSEYERFKDWAGETAKQRSIPFANFEGIVPHDAWGLFEGGPDFKHFSGEGHRLTALAITQAFKDVLVDSTSMKKTAR